MNTKIPILLYHSISDTSSARFRRWCLSPEHFGEHLNYLKSEGYTALTITEIARAIQDPTAVLPPRVVGISFDDGFADFYSGALPHLVRTGLKSTLYVTAGYIGLSSRWLERSGEGHRKILSWPQMREIASTGIVELGSHSLSHFQLDTLSLQDARDEITRSKEILEQNLSQEVESFAYPHGYHSREVRTLVVRAGYHSASAVKHGMSSRLDDPFALARIIIPNATTIPALARLLDGVGLPPVPTDEPFRTTGWRVARRVLGWLNNFQLDPASNPNTTKGGDETYGG